MATRIKARAVRRSGAFLKQIAPDKGGHPSKTRAGDRPGFSRGEVAREAGISRRWQKQVLRVAVAHPAQSDGLEIEAAAKRRLIDKYDAAKARGQVQRAGGDRTSIVAD